MRWVGIVVALAGLVATGACSSPEPTQPIAFSHSVHAGTHQIACTDCHRGAEDGVAAGLPAFGQCLTCHMRPQGAPPSAREAKVRELAAAGEPLRWTQVTRNPGHVYFSHRAHKHFANMTCVDCHGDVAAWNEPPTQPTAALVDMAACVSCHRERGASNECQICHR